MDISEKRILISGGGKRIGAAIVRALAADGARIIIHYNRSKAEAATLFAAIGGSKAGHELLQADFSNSSEVSDLFTQATAKGNIDVLINNASMYLDIPGADEKTEDATRQMQVNFHAPEQLIKLFAMQQNTADRCIINMLDQAVMQAVDNGGSYICSKKMLWHLTTGCAREMAEKNIRINAIAPGPVLPPADFKGDGLQKILKQVPLKRAVRLEDICETVKFIISNNSLTGAVIPLDCGMSL